MYITKLETNCQHHEQYCKDINLAHHWGKNMNRSIPDD